MGETPNKPEKSIGATVSLPNERVLNQVSQAIPEGDQKALSTWQPCSNAH